MKERALLLLLLLVTGFHTFAQGELFTEAFEDFATRRIWAYEEIPMKWTMKGLLQADMNEGVNSLFEEAPHLAETSFTAVLEKDSTIWQAYYYRAASRKLQKKYTKAIADLRRALTLHGDFYEGYVELAKIHHLRKYSEASEEAINKAIRLDKSRGAAYYVKGDIKFSKGEVRPSMNNYRECLEQDSMFHDARIKVALLNLITKKDAAPALKHLNQVLAYDSMQKAALLFRAILWKGEDKRQPVRDLTRLISVSPNDMMAHYFRGIYSTELEDYYQAFADFHKVIQATQTSDNNFKGQQTWLDKKIDLQNAGAYTITRVYGLPDDDALKIKKAYCQILIHEFDKSILTLASIVTSQQDPLVVYLKAVAYEHKGEHVKALNHYHHALTLDNEISDAHKKRGIYRQELKNWPGAVSDFTEVLRITPDAFVIHKIRGVSYYYNNQFSQAIADYDAYLRYDSGNAEVIGYRGMAYLQTGRRLQAYADFAVSENHQAINFTDAAKLIDSVFAKGDTAYAMETLEIMTESAPYFTEGYARQLKIKYERQDWTFIKGCITRAVRNSRTNAPKADHSFLLTLHAITLEQDHHRDDALNMFSDAIKFDKNNSVAYYERAKVHMEMGKRNKAESDLKTASSLGHEKAREMLALLPKS